MSPIKRIKKRDGRIADFDQSKITEAIWKELGNEELLISSAWPTAIK